MEKENLKCMLGNVIKIALSIAVYVIIMGCIHQKVGENFNYLAAKNTDVRESMNAYLDILYGLLKAAAVLNIMWWVIALAPYGTRRWFERNTLMCAVLLSLILFALIISKGYEGRIITDDIGRNHELFYSYAIGCGFLFNLFGFPPQTVEEVLLPGKFLIRCLTAAMAACITIGIIVW